MKYLLQNILAGLLLLAAARSTGQQTKGRFLTMQQAFDLAAANSTQLKVAESNTAYARQKTEIARTARLPELTSGLSYGYLSNSQAWDPSFGKHTTAPIPHNLTQFSVQASEVIFKGGEIANNLKKAALEEQIAVLSQQKELEDIRLLVAARYLDIYRLMNQRQVYIDNIRLSRERLKNILSLQKQGLVTNNDVLRTQLIISNLELAVRKTDDNIQLLNQQFNIVLGASIDEWLIPDSSMLAGMPKEEKLHLLMGAAAENNKELKIAGKQIETAQTNLKLIGADRYPRISLFAVNNFQRPYTNSTPALDIYFNNWIAGVSITYNISSIYQSPQKRKAGKILVDQAFEKEALQQENLELAVNADLVRYNQARYELATYTEDLKSAEENYRIVEKKYFNQLSLLADLIDATNTNIEAELKVSNARISILFTHYQLQRTIGKL